MKVARFIIAILTILSLTCGCSTVPLKNPVVTRMAYIPGYEAKGKMLASSGMVEPFYSYRPDRYCVEITGIDPDGKTRTETVFLKRDKFNDEELGKPFIP